MTQSPFDPSRFTTAKARPLPVILLLDVSGSMCEVIDGTYSRTGRTVVKDGQTWDLVTGGTTRIQLLNEAVRKMLATLAREEGLGHEFLVSMITFGTKTRLHLAPTKASSVAWTDLEADGETPLGTAIGLAKELIESKERTPSRAYRPTVVLVSDGKPTDEWQDPLAELVGAGRSAKCDRMAMAIGPAADEDVLQKFMIGTENQLVRAERAEQIHEFFRRVTMSVVSRTRSKDPNVLPPGGDVRPAAPSAAGQQEVSPEAADTVDDPGYW